MWALFVIIKYLILFYSNINKVIKEKLNFFRNLFIQLNSKIKSYFQ
jgi:hypothetical protein